MQLRWPYPTKNILLIVLFDWMISGVHSFEFIIYFDGSLRHSKSFTRNSVPSVAICSAAVFNSQSRLKPSDPTKNSINGTLVQLCSTVIPIYPGITSADAEYEGFILGLEKLYHILLQQPDSYENWSGSILIRGDCKTVIDQMKGDSTPRKQRTKYNQALGIIKRLGQLHIGSRGASIACTDSIQLVYEHVQRKENELCDSLCTTVLNNLQRHEFNSIQEMIHLKYNCDTNGPIARKSHEIDQDIPILSIVKRIDILDDVHLPLHWRPALFLSMGLTALKRNDRTTLFCIGQALVDTISRLNGQSNIDVYIRQWKDVGHVFKVLGYSSKEKNTKRIVNPSSSELWNDEAWHTKLESLYSQSLQLVSLNISLHTCLLVEDGT